MQLLNQFVWTAAWSHCKFPTLLEYCIIRLLSECICNGVYFLCVSGLHCVSAFICTAQSEGSALWGSLSVSQGSIWHCDVSDLGTKSQVLHLIFICVFSCLKTFCLCVYFPLQSIGFHWQFKQPMVLWFCIWCYCSQCDSAFLWVLHTI